MGGAARVMLAFVGVLATLRLSPDVAPPAVAAAEGTVLWGWGATPPGPDPATQPPGAEGTQGSSPSPVGADHTAGPAESEDSGSGATGTPPPPPPESPGPSAETSWRDGWALFPETFGY